MAVYGNGWQKYCNLRSSGVNVFDEIECSKMMRDMINSYFTIGKKDIYGITNYKAPLRNDCSASNAENNYDRVDSFIDTFTDKYIQGWNVGYYMQYIKCGLKE